MTGVIALAATLALASAFGVWRAKTDGRWHQSTRLPDLVQTPTGPTSSQLSAAELGAEFGERATLVQFSSAFCAPCRTTRVILREVADSVPGVIALDIDAESHLDLIRRLDVRRTPTTLVLDQGGVIRSRAVGAPRKAEVFAALDKALNAI